MLHLKIQVYKICTAFKDKDNTGAVSQWLQTRVSHVNINQVLKLILDNHCGSLCYILQQVNITVGSIQTQDLTFSQ